jgi:hypothetical protein
MNGKKHNKINNRKKDELKGLLNVLYHAYDKGVYMCRRLSIIDRTSQVKLRLLTRRRSEEEGKITRRESRDRSEKEDESVEHRLLLLHKDIGGQW